jgi:hypothetical protein
MKTLTLAWIVAVSQLAVPPLAGASSVPPGVQAVMFRKIVGYDKPLSSKKAEEVVVCIAYDTEKVAAEELAQAFRATGLKAAALELVTVPRHIDRIDLLYLFTAKEAAQLKPQLGGTEILTISGDAGLVELGVVSVALGLDAEGKPRIFVNVRKMKEEGHSLHATVLSLATVTH